MRILSCIEAPPPPKLWDSWPAVATHSHMLRSGKSDPKQAASNLIEWCRINKIAAAGIGSPWEPLTAAHYKRCESVDRDAYYAGRLDQEALMERKTVSAFIGKLNRLAKGRTLFFLDNETPKGRMGHMWHLGFDYQVPAWHDYSQDRHVAYWSNDTKAEINPLTGAPHARRPSLEIAALQRKAGAVPVWAHPTSWWHGKDGKFVTNIAADMPLHLLCDGRLDGITVQGYDSWHPSYMALWLHLLDTGATVPGFAENDSCFDSQNILGDSRNKHFNRIFIDGPVSMGAIVEGAKSGRLFASTGPFIEIEADGVPMGSSLRTSQSSLHHVRITAFPAPCEKRLSLIRIFTRGGKIAAEFRNFRGGTLELALPGSAKPSYVLAACFGAHDAPDSMRQQDIRSAAISNPVYLRPSGFQFKPMKTACSLKVGSGSPWLGARMRVQNAAGETIDSVPCLCRGTMRFSAPASAKIVLDGKGRRSAALFLAMENPAVQRLLNSISTGQFLKRHPGLKPGEVPASEFKLKSFAKALERISLEI